MCEWRPSGFQARGFVYNVLLFCTSNHDMFSRKDVFTLFDGRLRIFTRKTNDEPRFEPRVEAREKCEGAHEEGGRETPARRPLFFSFLTSTRRMLKSWLVSLQNKSITALIYLSDWLKSTSRYWITYRSFSNHYFMLFVVSEAWWDFCTEFIVRIRNWSHEFQLQWRIKESN